MTNSRKLRGALLLTGAVFTASTLNAGSAQATSRKDYKTGAAVLGALGVILAVKGKTLPAAVLGAGAYYSYKKGQDTYDGANRYPRNARNNRDRDRYSRNDNYDANRYPDNNNYGNYGNGSYNAGDVYAGDVFGSNGNYDYGTRTRRESHASYGYGQNSYGQNNANTYPDSDDTRWNSNQKYDTHNYGKSQHHDRERNNRERNNNDDQVEID